MNYGNNKISEFNYGFYIKYYEFFVEDHATLEDSKSFKRDP